MTPDRLRDSFDVWNVDWAGREVVLRNSDKQYIAVPLPEEHADLLEELAEAGGTLDATLVASSGRTSWAVDAVHGVERGE